MPMTRPIWPGSAFTAASAWKGYENMLARALLATRRCLVRAPPGLADQIRSLMKTFGLIVPASKRGHFDPESRRLLSGYRNSEHVLLPFPEARIAGHSHATEPRCQLLHFARPQRSLPAADVDPRHQSDHRDAFHLSHRRPRKLPAIPISRRLDRIEHAPLPNPVKSIAMGICRDARPPICMVCCTRLPPRRAAARGVQSRPLVDRVQDGTCRALLPRSCRCLRRARDHRGS